MQFHVRFDVPSCPPFDRRDWHWQAYGEIILPFIENNALSRFWFSRYGTLGYGPYVLFRYEANTQATPISPYTPSEHRAFDIINDLSGPRFCGTNNRLSECSSRGAMIFDFLNCTAHLTLSLLSHKDAKGYWVLEESADRGNNHFGSPMESVHHLFCNSSATPTGIALCHVKDTNNDQDMIVPLGLIRAKNSKLMKADTQVVRIEH